MADAFSTISYNAFNGDLIPRTVCFQGFVNHSLLSILVDSGSMHNFMQAWVAKHLGLVVLPVPQFQVVIGNGKKLLCQGQCKDVFIDMHGFQFQATFYVLAIQGEDLVLRVQWFQELGLVTINYSELTMSF